MPGNKAIQLNEHYESFVRERVDSGEFATASEVVRAGLRLLEAETRRLDALRRALREGEESGAAQSLDLEAFLNEMAAQEDG